MTNVILADDLYHGKGGMPAQPERLLCIKLQDSFALSPLLVFSP
jgi:hypothetical protein